MDAVLSKYTQQNRMNEGVFPARLFSYIAALSFQLLLYGRQGKPCLLYMKK